MRHCPECKSVRGDAEEIKAAKVGMSASGIITVGEYRRAWECCECSATVWVEDEPKEPDGHSILLGDGSV